MELALFLRSVSASMTECLGKNLAIMARISTSEQLANANTACDNCPKPQRHRSCHKYFAEGGALTHLVCESIALGVIHRKCGAHRAVSVRCRLQKPWQQDLTQPCNVRGDAQQQHGGRGKHALVGFQTT